MQHKRRTKIEIYNDNFQNYKKYGIPKAQLVIADIPYNLGKNAYASNPLWYNGGDNKKGESKKANSTFFNTDGYFKIAEYMHFCSRLLIKEPKEKGKAPAMIVFCAFEQIPTVVEFGRKHGFKNWYPIHFIKNYSAQVLKANMKIVGLQSMRLYYIGINYLNSIMARKKPAKAKWFLTILTGIEIIKISTLKYIRHRNL